MIRRLLIANRGEIACRIVRTARAMGVRTIAVYSDADADALHVRLADEAFRIGPPPAPESYLDAGAVLKAARAGAADAIHPGYGFLSENAEFATRVAAEGLVFVGPPPAAIAAMGSKSAAKALMEAAGVPILPGYHGEGQADDLIAAEAQRIGYPVMLKAAAGGGGKGMRLVREAGELLPALASARREAKAAFGDERFLVEKYLESPRHVEVQVFADGHGNGVHLFERDCSIQRRHQKVIEEAPAPGLPEKLRTEMGAAAVTAARAIGYVGAGTVEFLFDGRGSFYFMEMNTRLQVEHPVTEAVTGLDLVEWQLRVAGGEKLPLGQKEIALDGHAIEARLYAEAPERGFLPSTGRLRHLAFGPGIRIDTGVEAGAEVSPYYDPMIAKMIAHGETREIARRRLADALAETQIVGVRTNARFLRRLLETPDFAAGKVDTGFIERHGESLLPEAGGPSLTHRLVAVLWRLARLARLRGSSPWDAPSGFRVNLPAEIRVSLLVEEEEQSYSARPTSEGYRIAFGTESHEGACELLDGGRLAARIDGRRLVARIAETAEGIAVLHDGVEHEIRFPELVARDESAVASEGSLAAPMPGTVVAVKVEPGRAVAAGDPLVVLEAMKMEHVIRAPAAGKVREIFFAAGDAVKEGDLLVALEEG
ncbi:MAG: acetyl/propionyl/methylcrotonyl-CoA carboxylase subunit alpha [Alphaproteobacteria bacterium]|nr:acetyl/propionyl/methylcrotonyl-CoA carboxylase subunit alpha [Alphaproteobacteria bacterium]